MKTSETPLISVIIPAYNAEKYVAKCLKSIQNNTYKNLEIIVINDGSKDNTQSVVESFMEDKRIVLINVENGGVSKARNLGLDRATGEYVAFIDSDDYVREDYFEELIALCICDDADMSCCAYERVDVNGTVVTDSRKVFNEIIFATPQEIADGYFDFYDKGVVNFPIRIYKRSVVGEIRFSETLKWGEDGSFNLDIFRNAKKLAFSNVRMYFYVVNPNQVTTKKMPGYTYMMIQHIGDIDGFLESYNAYRLEKVRGRMGSTCIEVLVECADHTDSLKSYKKEFHDFLSQPWCKYIYESGCLKLRWKVMRFFAKHGFYQGVYYATKLHRFYIKIKRKLKR